MAQIKNRDDFITELKKFDSKVRYEFSNQKIIIEETEEKGKGEIFLDISNYSHDNYLFAKIEHRKSHTIGENGQHNDGIILKINLIDKRIDVHFFELKKQLTFKALLTASNQLANAYRFIKYLQLEECFVVKYRFYIVYQENNIGKDASILKDLKGFNWKLFKAIYKNQDKIPLKIPFCKYREFDFQQVEFGKTIQI